MAGVVGGLLAAVLVLGAIDTFVWLPEATAPSTPLDRIYAALGDSGDLIACVASPVIWFGFWAVLGTLFVATQLPAHPAFRPVLLRPVSAAAIGLLLLGGAGFFHWWSAFAMGMSVSDELPPGYGTTTPVGVVIVLGGLLAIAVGALLGIAALVTRPRAAPALS